MAFGPFLLISLYYCFAGCRFCVDSSCYLATAILYILFCMYSSIKDLSLKWQDFTATSHVHKIYRDWDYTENTNKCHKSNSNFLHSNISSETKRFQLNNRLRNNRFQPVLKLTEVSVQNDTHGCHRNSIIIWGP